MIVGRILLIWPYIGFGCAELPKLLDYSLKLKKIHFIFVYGVGGWEELGFLRIFQYQVLNLEHHGATILFCA